jgi:hypothetical protein
LARSTKPARGKRKAEQSKRGEFGAVFAALKPIFLRYKGKLTPYADQPGKYYVVSKSQMYRGKPFWVGGVEIRKNHVSFYLMSVYCFPELLNSISPGLKKRMQGKACFNFTSVDRKFFGELRRLVAAGFDRAKALTG